jgi:DNA-binding MarR family transcriptional regulator
MARAFKLNNIQLILLTTALQRDDGSLLPPPESIGGQGQRIRTAVTALLKRGLAEEVDAADPACSWRDDGERCIGVVITDAGRLAIGAEIPSIDEEAQLVTNSKAEEPLHPEQGEPPAAAQPVITARPGTKQALVLDLLQRKQGASITELAEATGWLPHTTRAALTGLRKRGAELTSAKTDGVTRYRMAVARG